MPTTNRVTIIVDDSAVYTDQGVYSELDLSDCGIPDNVHALQFKDGAGEIEWKQAIPNTLIDSLPNWATNCLAKWDIAHSTGEA
jgi:hypothetical protein